MGWFERILKRESKSSQKPVEVLLMLGTHCQEIVERVVDKSFDESSDRPELDSLGAALVSGVIPIWALAHHKLGQVIEPSFERVADDYYGRFWGLLKARFGSRREIYDQRLRELGGFFIPDSIKTNWAQNTRIHDIVSWTATNVGEGADRFLEATAETGSVAALELGRRVAALLLPRPGERPTAVSLVCYTAFIEAAKFTQSALDELMESDVGSEDATRSQ